MDLMSLLVRIGADTSSAEQGIKKTQTLGQKLSKGLKTAAKVGATAIAGATAAVVAFTKASVDVGRKFDKSMSQVAATMGVTTDEIDDLRKFAQKMGRETAFSATQAADALNYMALAGYDAETSMNMLPNVLNLAAAGGMDLATASDMVTDAQSALGLSLDETSEMVDKMAKASSKSNTSVSQLGEAFLTIGGTAKNLKGGTTELATALGILADNGVKGSEGGTALRNVLLNLTPKSEDAAKAMEQIGLKAYDANGEMRPLKDIFHDMNVAMADMSTEQRQNILSNIFNKVDLKSVNALMSTSVERWDELATAIDGAWYTTESLTKSLGDAGISMDTVKENLSKLGITADKFDYSLSVSNGDATDFAETLWETADAGVSMDDILAAMGGDLNAVQTAFDNTTGAAQQMADTQLDNLEGDITLFESALEGAQIAISDQVTPALRDFVQFGTEGVSQLTEAFEKDGLNGAMEALGHIISDGVVLIIDGLPQFVDAGIKLLGAIIQGIMDNFPALIKAAGQIAETIISNIMSYVEEKNPQLAKVLNKIGGAVKEVYEAIKGYWNDTLKPAFDTMMTWIRDTLLPTISNAWQNLQPIVGDVFDALKEFWTNTLKPIYQSMKKWIEEDLIPKFKGAWQSAQDKVDDVFRGISTLWNEVLKPIFNGIMTFLSKTLQPAFENVFSAISTTVDTTLGGIEKLWNESVKPIYNGILTFFKGVFKGDFEMAWDGIQKIVEGNWNAIQTAAETAWENAKTWGSTIVANFTLAFQNAWNLVKGSVLGLWDGFKAKATEIWEGAKQWGATIIANFTLAFTNAWNLVKNTVTGLWDAIKDKAKELWTSAKQWASTIIANFTLSFKNSWDLVKKSVVGLWDAIKDKAEELWKGAKDWGKNIVNNFKNSISTTWTTAIKGIKLLFKQIPDAIGDIVKSALNWGQDLIDNFKKGIENKWQGLKDKVEGVANSIKDFLGFSQPKEGPLSDFDTYAPDMMNLFIKGINDNITVLKATLFSLTQYIKQEFKSAGEKAYSSFKEGYDGYWGDQMKNAIKNPIESAYYAIRDMHWWDLADGIYRDVTHVCSWIHDAYKNAFDFSNMYVKTPHWSVDKWNEISGTYYPEMSVSWYRKAYDNPVMFTNPTVLGTPYGLKGFGDGPGGEIVLSAEKLRGIVGTAGGTTNNTINVYQRDGENMDAFVRRIEEIMTRHDNQRKAAFL